MMSGVQLGDGLRFIQRIGAGEDEEVQLPRAVDGLFICGRLMGFSQWLIITPTAPAAFKPSGRISAQPRPGAGDPYTSPARTDASCFPPHGGPPAPGR